MASVLGDDRGQQQNTADSLGQDAQSAIKMGADAARAAKNAGKTAKTVAAASANLASGNVAGAVVEVAKNPGAVISLVKGIVIALLSLCFLLVAVLHVIPTALYDHIEGYFSQAGARWEKIYVSNEYGGNAVANFLIWCGETFNANAEFLPSLTQDDDYERELAMMDNEYAEKLALIDRIYIVDEKLRMRAEQVKSGVKESAAKATVGTFLKGLVESDEWTEDKGDVQAFETPIVNVTLESPFENLVAGQTERRKGLNKLKQMAKTFPENGTSEEKDEWRAKFNKTIYDPDNETGYFPPEDNANALRVLNLVMVQKNASLRDLKTTDLMKYMGWYSNTFGGSKTTTIKLGNAVDYSILDWKGTFVPQYMMEEQKTIQEYITRLEREKKGYNVATDRALVAATDAKLNQYKTILSSYENKGIAFADLLIELDYPNLNIFNSDVQYNPSEVKTESNTSDGVTHYDVYYYFKNPDGNGKLTLHEWWAEPLVETPDTEITHNYQFTIDAYVLCRDVFSTSSAIGLWNGSFEEDLEVRYPDTP